MQGCHRDVAVPHGLIVRPIVRLPLVLPLLNPEIRPALWIMAFGYRCDVVSPGLDGHPTALGLALRDVDVEERPWRKASAEKHFRQIGGSTGGEAEIVLLAR